MASGECERCGASAGYDDKDDPRCVEIELVAGLIAFLCFECRKRWMRIQRVHEVVGKYSETSLRLEYWKAVTSAAGKTTIDEGLKLWRELDAIERELCKLGDEFLKEQQIDAT